MMRELVRRPLNWDQSLLSKDNRKQASKSPFVSIRTWKSTPTLLAFLCYASYLSIFLPWDKRYVTLRGENLFKTVITLPYPWFWLSHDASRRKSGRQRLVTCSQSRELSPSLHLLNCEDFQESNGFKAKATWLKRNRNWTKINGCYFLLGLPYLLILFNQGRVHELLYLVKATTTSIIKLVRSYMVTLETWQNEINLDLVVFTPVTENVLERNLFFFRELHP